MRTFLIATLASLTLAAPAIAQSSLDDIEAALGSATEELVRVDAILADPDPNRRVAGMQLLLKSGNPVFVQRAKEAGLLSSDPEMQKAAVAAIFEAGGPFRAEFDIKGADEKKTRIREWVAKHTGSYDESAGIAQTSFTVQPYDSEAKCWKFAPNYNNCAIYPTGANYALDGWDNAAGSVSLNTEGVLEGHLLVKYSKVTESVPIRIPLLD